MNNSEKHFINLRSRKIPRPVPEATATTSQPQTSTPNRSPDESLGNLGKSVRDTTQFLREISSDIDGNLSILFPHLSRSCISPLRMAEQGVFYNKELASLMTTNIPKFQLNSGNNPALELRSFIKSCENVLSLFDPQDEETKEEFFKLIKFRLGYDVQERLTVDKFEDIQSLENHLRSVCHLKLNKGKLLSEIRHERQQYNEDVSHFVERLRKLIAQGRSEYPNDREFEREAIHTLKNSVKNEFISIKLMDSNTNKFEELAEIAINRDSDLHQRAYKTSKTTEPASQDLINKLMEKIKILEDKQAATVQHIRHEPRFRAKSPYRVNNPQRSPNRNIIFCNYCKRSGHHINDCRTKNRNQGYNNPNSYNSNQYRNNRNHSPRTYSPHNGRNSQHQYDTNHYSHNNRCNRDYENSNYERNFQNQNNHSPDRDSRNQPMNSNRPQENSNRYAQNLHQENRGSTNCLRCNQPGHKSNNCYEIICRNCKQIGHAHNQCLQNSPARRVHFTQCDHETNNYPDQGNE